jgi:hypothetical protein
LYVDGRPVFTFETTALKGDLSNDQPLRIGNHCDPSFRTFFKGIINQVAIYNRALSAAEVDALYEEQSNGEPPALPSPAPPAPPFSPSVHRQDEAVFGGKMKPGSIGGATD